jgi:hypothetical protein
LGVISSVYTVKGSENGTYEDIFGDKEQKKEPTLSGVYNWLEKKVEDSSHEGMSKVLVDGSSKMKGYWDDFSGKVTEKIKENNIHKGIGGSLFGPFEAERHENKEVNKEEDKGEGDNNIQEKDQEKERKMFKDLSVGRSTSLKLNFKNWFKTETPN